MVGTVPRPDAPIEGIPDPLPPSAGGLSRRRRLIGLVACAVGLPALTGVLVLLRDQVSLDAVLPIYLLAVALDEVVAAALLSLGQGDVRVDVPEDLPAVLADAGLLERIIANLVANARRFTPAGAPARIEASRGGPGSVSLRIVDHGPGVPPQRWDDMFQPFQTLGDRDPSAGLGMGLAIARGFTEAMGIALAPEPTPGGGLTMRLTLPVAP
jgi:two-component system, OmpR family, sensor histidine kinase KdpD